MVRGKTSCRQRQFSGLGLASVPYHVEAIDVMHISVLPAPIVLGILEHGDLRTVEHRWFIHVIPDIEVGSRALRTQGRKWEQRTEGREEDKQCESRELLGVQTDAPLRVLPGSSRALISYKQPTTAGLAGRD